ncbi:MAG TPA: GDSL-type esterase/lipase family protein [Ktedonobacterales bacterium]|nr:GDSL-type esterase/lipase family protein [Ktedonobacterales bacterium]
MKAKHFALGVIGVALALSLVIQAFAIENGVRASAHKASAPSRRLLIVGDSISVGFYASLSAKSYASLVAAGLHATLMLRAVSGIGAPKMLTNLETSAPPPSQDFIIVELGTNDGWGDRSQFVQAYSTLLKLLRRGSPHARLDCAGPWRPHNLAADADALTIRQDCAAAGGVFVDLQKIYANSAYRGPLGRPTQYGRGDDFHPNDKGHALIARLMLQALLG